ncbi:MAG: hypothetical protein NTZ38_00025 [Candidatus Taylorbacteria bacterium]|nr:hypothetical protein [Candidatus Taylorbacteria bacterium]
MRRAPLKSHRNLSLGLYRAESLGSTISTKKVDMAAAKAVIRQNRQIRLSGPQQIRAAKNKARQLKNWWNYRRFWKSVRIGNRSGKLHPDHRNRVEFPDGSIEWLE